MEKMVATKRKEQVEISHLKKDTKSVKQDKNKKIQKNKKYNNFIEKLQKTIKNSQFFSIIQKKYVNFLVLFAFLVLITTLCLITFLHNDFYNFIARPKVLESSAVIVLIILFLSILVFAFYVSNAFYQSKSKLQKTDNENKKVTDLKIKNRKIKFLKKEIFMYVFLYCCLCLLFLFFSIKVLSVCVIFSFFVFIDCLAIFISSKKLWQKMFLMPVLLDAICLFLSFYFMFLLN